MKTIKDLYELFQSRIFGLLNGFICNLKANNGGT